MTPQMMAIRTHEQLISLDQQTKVELLAWVRNQMQVVCGDQENAINRSKYFVRELNELLQVKKERNSANGDRNHE